MLSWTVALSLFIAGGLGALLRVGVGLGVAQWNLRPWNGTLIVNVVGSLLYLILAKWGFNKESEFVLKAGFLGGLTTFSSFSFELYQAFHAELWTEFMAILGLNILFGVIVGILVIR